MHMYQVDTIEQNCVELEGIGTEDVVLPFRNIQCLKKDDVGRITVVMLNGESYEFHTEKEEFERLKQVL